MEGDSGDSGGEWREGGREGVRGIVEGDSGGEWRGGYDTLSYLAGLRLHINMATLSCKGGVV